jgi:two-component system, cell cycle response regulator
MHPNVTQKILAIDDAPSIHSLLKVRLREEPVELHAAIDGESGIRIAESLQPDLILLDVEMPGMDGFTVCKSLKDNPATQHIPIIFLSSVTTTQEKIRGLDLGACDYIAKPFDPAELRARVRATLRTKYLVELLAKRAMVDALTGLYNRAYLDARIPQEMSLSRRTGHPLSCIMADVDHFKSLNDRFGHPGGDDILRTVSQVLAETIRTEDVLCRYGGEEFAILAPNTNEQQAADLANRCRLALANHPFICRGQTVQVTASFGVAQLTTTPPDLVELADEALYRAKSEGRNRVAIAPPVTAVAA